MTRVSVIVDNYNYAEYLPAAVDSALGQDWEDLEVVVVDDGSTDDSLRVLDRYGERILTVAQRNAGQASAFAAGFAVSSGDVVIFLDADDVLLPTAARRAVSVLEGSPRIVKVSWPMWQIDGAGERLEGMQPPHPLSRGDLKDLALEQGAHCYVTPPTSGNAWTRTYLAEVLPAPENEYRLSADAYLFTLAPLFGLIEAIDEPQSCYRVHSSNGYWKSNLYDRVTATLRCYGPCARVFEDAVRRLGLPMDGARRGNDYIAWIRRLKAVLEEVQSAVPIGGPFLLLDEGQWGGRLLADRAHVPFTERDGVWWGPPADDAAAVAELRRQIANGVQHVVIGWPAFWYLDCYPGLLAHLEPVSSSEDVQVYRVRTQS